jgi:single-stranded DNA-specific DHH superfamily exonuclease
MISYDVFNGDADGICALQQLRLHTPKQSVLITGLKRDIDLLSRVEASPGDEITVLDVSLEKNRAALDRVLNAGASVFYADHHFPGDIPKHQKLDVHIDVTADTCTSLIVNEYLQGTNTRWAVVGAFGDNFDQTARDLGMSIGLTESELTQLQQLGICLNYNGYGFELDDLMFHPEVLFQMIRPYSDPLDFIVLEAGYGALLAQFQTDMKMAEDFGPQTSNADGATYLLPNESWAKRVVGVMGNDLAKKYPDRAHALLVDMGNKGYRVSVRAPYNRKHGADELCRQFESGGGRKAAAGINQLPSNLLAQFEKLFYQQFIDDKKRLLGTPVESWTN